MDATSKKPIHNRLPDFLVAGVQKSGTTTLHHLLQDHPEIYFPPRPQEIHFFDNDAAYERGLDWYADLFSEASADQLAGQTSPLYIYLESAAHRIHQHLPNAKIIIILRHPVSRAYSHYWNSVRYGYERHSFEDALQQESARLKLGGNKRRDYSYIDRGRYTTQLELYRKLFSIDNMLVLTQDELREDPTSVVHQCCEFLGIATSFYETYDHGTTSHNKSRLPIFPSIQLLRPHLERYGLNTATRLVDKLNLTEREYPPMSSQTKQYLDNLFSDEIDTLKNWLYQHKGYTLKWN